MKREFSLVCAAVFLLATGTYISGTLLVPYATSLGGTGFSIGVIYASMYVVRLIFGGPIGHLSQKKGAKTILKYSLILYPFIAIAYAVSWNIPSLLFARLFHGLASAMLLPMAMAYIAEVSPAGEEGRYMGIYNTILFAASAIGPVVGGTIYDRYGVTRAFYALFLFALAALVIILLAARGDKGHPQAHDGVQAAVPPHGRGLGIFRMEGMSGLCAMNIVQAVLLALLGASFTQLALSLGMKMSTVGMLIALNNVVIGAVQIPFGKLADRYDKLKIITASGVGIALLVLLLPLVRGVWGLAALLAILGVFTALNLSSATALAVVLGRQSGMGVMMGFLGSANSMGTIVGYLALGGIADRLGIHAAFYFTGLLFPLALLLLGMQRRQFSWSRQAQG